MNKKTMNIFLLILLLNTYCVYSMMEMAVMMGAQQGASVANEAINKMFADIGQAVMKEQKNLQNSMQEFTTNVVAAQSKDAQFLGKVFQEAVKHIGKQESSQSQYTQKMRDYIFKMLSLHKPGFYYLLESAILFDQAFTNGTMFTPTDHLWKNVFAKGNWEYDHTTDSFWQLLKEPVLSANDTTGTDASTPFSGAYNSIFTEYMAHAGSYEIECQITLYNIEYPFFAGIMFNKTRWISGNSDSLTKCRLIGIAGHEKNDIGVYFAEQYTKQITKTSNNAATSSVLYPLNQIINKNVQPQKQLSYKLFENLYADPLTLVCRIITSPKTINFKTWQKGTKEPNEFITITNNNQDTFMYHGIGFMSPGAIAEFKLIKPAKLLFSEETKQQYDQTVQQLLTVQRAPLQQSNIKKKG